MPDYYKVVNMPIKYQYVIMFPMFWGIQLPQPYKEKNP